MSDSTLDDSETAAADDAAGGEALTERDYETQRERDAAHIGPAESENRAPVTC